MTAARGFLGAGDVYINRIVGGVKQGMLGPYFSNKFELKLKTKRVELSSKGKTTYGQILESVSVQEPAGFTLELAEVNKESMAIALLGSSVASNQTSGSLTAEAITAKLDTWIPLSKNTLTGAQTVTNAGATVTYVAGVDYVVNAAMGWVKALSTGTIVADEALKVTSTYGAFSGTKISGATDINIRAEIVFDGVNQADGSQCTVTINEAIISSDAAFDFLADKFGNVNLPGTMKTPLGMDAPFTVVIQNV